MQNPGNRRITILLVEDSPDDVELFRQTLQSVSLSDFELAQVDRLCQALARLEEGGIDVVLLDLSLPDCEGIESLRRLNAAAPGIPIIVLTGRDDEALALAVMRAGAQDYLVKGQLKGPLLARAVRYAIERKRAEDILREREVRLRLLTEHVPAVLWTTDSALRLTSVSGAALADLDLAPSQLLGKTVGEILSPGEADNPVMAAHRQALEGTSATCEQPWGASVYRTYVEPLRDRAGGVIGCVGLALDVTDSKRMEDRLFHLANHDPLTDLFNRRRFEEELAEQLKRARLHGTAGAVLLMDLDGFKEVNDGFGHPVGDQLLLRVAEELKGRLRQGDLLARLGGDEFALLLPYADPTQAHAVADRMVASVRRVLLPVSGRTVGVTASVGIVFYPDHGSTVEELMGHADVALYRAKDAGGDRPHQYAPEAPEGHTGAHSWTVRIREALAQELLRLYARPVVDLRNGDVALYSLTPRLLNGGESERPGALQRYAERAGLTGEIDRWLVREALRLLARRREREKELRLHVSLSGSALTDPQILELIREDLGGNGLDASRLVVEIPEAAVIHDPDRARKFAEMLDDLGCGVGVGGVRLGLPSVDYLKQVPVDFFRLEGGRIRDLALDRVDQHLVRALAEVAAVLGAETIADSVQYDHTKQLLRELGVVYAQGRVAGQSRPAVDLLGDEEGGSE